MRDTAVKIGRPNRAQVYQASQQVEQVEQRIGMPVNPVIASEKRWADDSDPLMRQIRFSPSVAVDLPCLVAGA